MQIEVIGPGCPSCRRLRRRVDEVVRPENACWRPAATCGVMLRALAG